MESIRILIDADGCPVTKLTLRIAAEYGVPKRRMKHLKLHCGR